MDSDRDEKIRTRAYRIWEREGRPEGREHDHWKQAAEELEGETAAGGTAGQTLEVTPFNDPTRSGGPVEGGPRPPAASGISSGLQSGGTRPGGGAAVTQGAVGTGGGSTANRPSGTPSKGR